MTHDEPSTTRKSLPLSASDLAELEHVRTSAAHREVLSALSHEAVPPGASEARLLHALMVAGLAAVRHQVEAEGYATLATERTTAPRKAVARRRQPSWAGE